MNSFYVKSLQDKVIEIFCGNERWAKISQNNGISVIEFYLQSKKLSKYLTKEILDILTGIEKKIPALEKPEEEFWISNEGVFPNIEDGTIEQINEQGQILLEGILNDPKKEIYRYPDGSIKIYTPMGRGVFYNKGESFRGFIEKKYEKGNFFLELCSDLDFEGMVIDIGYNGIIIASLDYDRGIDNIEVKFFPFGYIKQEVPLLGFLDILRKAVQLAEKCAKEDLER